MYEKNIILLHYACSLNCDRPSACKAVLLPCFVPRTRTAEQTNATSIADLKDES